MATRTSGGQLVAELLLDDVADHPVRLGAEDVERIDGHVRVRGALEGEETDLRAVPVRDDELVLERERRESLAGRPCVRPLVLRRERLTAAQERIATECDDDAHVSSRGWRP